MFEPRVRPFNFKARLRALFTPKPPPPPPPPDPHASFMHMKVAWRYFNQAFDEKGNYDDMLYTLGKAAEALKEARRSDPTVRLKETDKDGKVVDYTQDELSLMLLSSEANCLEKMATQIHESDPVTDDHIMHPFLMKQLKVRHEAKRDELLGKALIARTKALAYAPNDVEHLHNLASLHAYRREYGTANRYLDKALAIDPHNIEAFQLDQMLRKEGNRRVGG